MWLPYLVLFLPCVVNAIPWIFQRTLNNFNFCVSTSISELHCGTNRLQNRASTCTLKVLCPRVFEEMNDCCHAHDKCYKCSDGESQKYCDDVFKICLNRAAPGGTCRILGSTMYGLVRAAGFTRFEGTKCSYMETSY